jgi:hypothetical protein
MALADLKPKSDVWTGVAIGVGLLLAPVVIPIVAAGMRPLMKMAVKNGVLLYEKGRELVAEVMEGAEDLLEEVKAEVKEELETSKEGSGSIQ